MRITVFGASGMVGSRILAEAVARGHRVVAASRGTCDRHDVAPPMSPEDRVVRVRADASAPSTLGPALSRADAAVVTIRPRPGAEHTIAPLTRAVLAQTAPLGIPTLVVGGAGPLRSPHGDNLLVADDRAFVPAAWEAVARASTAQLLVCQEFPDAPWTYLSPPAVLEPGLRTGRYGRGTDTLLTGAGGDSRITVEDLAVAALDELEDPGAERHITVVARP